jgi:hypothetical protein
MLSQNSFVAAAVLLGGAVEGVQLKMNNNYNNSSYYQTHRAQHNGQQGLHQGISQQQYTGQITNFNQLPLGTQQKINNDVASFRAEKRKELLNQARLAKAQKLENRKNFMTKTEDGVDIKHQLREWWQKLHKKKRDNWVWQQRRKMMMGEQIQTNGCPPMIQADTDQEMEAAIKDELENLTQAHRARLENLAYQASIDQQERTEDLIGQGGQTGFAYYSDFN